MCNSHENSLQVGVPTSFSFVNFDNLTLKTTKNFANVVLLPENDHFTMHIDLGTSKIVARGILINNKLFVSNDGLNLKYDYSNNLLTFSSFDNSTQSVGTASANGCVGVCW